MYEEPTRLPEPLDLPAPSAAPVYLFGAWGALLLGFALYWIAKLGYVLIVYDVLLGFGLGHAVALGVRWGRYPLPVARLVAGLATFAFLLFNVLLYRSSIAGVIGTRPNFLEFLAYRASQQALVLDFNPGAWLNVVIWILEIALCSFVALRIANRAIAQVKLESVPTPVTEFVLFLLFQGHGTAEIQTELERRGWTRPVDIVRALDAAQVAVDMIRTPEAPKPPET